MIRGTTPTHTFKLPFAVSLIAQAQIVYAQENEVLFVKTIEQCELGEDTLKVTLSQEETFMFNCNKLLQIHLRVLTFAGDALATSIKVLNVQQCLYDEVMNL